MNDKQRVRYEACKRSWGFGTDYSGTIPAGSQMETDFHDLGVDVNGIETVMGQQTAAKAESGQQFELKDVSREDLIDALTAPANAARAAEPTNPGTQDRFRFNRGLNDADLLAAANSFLACDATEEALLITFMAPAAWKADLTAARNAFDTAFSTAASADDAEVAATAELDNRINSAMQRKRTIGHMIPNVFGGDPAAMAAWHAASTVEKINKKKQPTP